ncbi:MAG: YdcF family protein [Mizugakiibacter sp.]|uniref:YdcF family protein n=1 Tax=Mizugakiibacter sp. TaxID=1972610 RepID=UPI0031C28722|nr:YdcF family protein [Xanthomonadaceae bacterium]
MLRVPAFLRRGPFRYLGDPDVWHSLAVTATAVALSGGLLWIGYFAHTLRLALRAPTRPRGPRVALVFGRRLRDGAVEADYAARLERARALAEAGALERLLLLGGDCGDGISEAAAGHAYLLARGLSANLPVLLEQDSIDSLENLRHARDLLGEPLPPVLLVTSRYHLARCVHLARGLGFEVEPCAAEPRLPRSPRYLRRLLIESGYLMWIDVGARWARLIGHRRMLGRLR